MNLKKNHLISKVHSNMPRCNSNCVLIRESIGNFPPPPALVASTHKICSTCNTRSVSKYEHNLCYHCAPEGSVEFNYHHQRCIPSTNMNATPSIIIYD